MLVDHLLRSGFYLAAQKLADSSELGVSLCVCMHVLRVCVCVVMFVIVLWCVCLCGVCACMLWYVSMGG